VSNAGLRPPELFQLRPSGGVSFDILSIISTTGPAFFFAGWPGLRRRKVPVAVGSRPGVATTDVERVLEALLGSRVEIKLAAAALGRNSWLFGLSFALIAALALVLLDADISGAPAGPVGGRPAAN
jgi:hypothetical protein